ncbi:MAG: hypothetical protein ABIQ95_08690 [Bdellovibrionia bacterium]
MLKLRTVILQKYGNFSKWILFVFLFSFGLPISAVAYQNAKVIEKSADVYEMPDSHSNELTSLKKDQEIKISSKWVTDEKGRNWYKVFTGSEFGYILANKVATFSMNRELAGMKIQSFTNRSTDESDGSWHFLLRGMLSYAPLLVANSTIGKELEFSFAPGFFGQGIWHHVLSFGGAYLNYLPGAPVWAGSVIFRVPTLWVLKPEFRLRAGLSSARIIQFGGVLGINYPFSLHYGMHLSGFVDAGSMVLLPSSYYLYVSAGIGLHF